ncbi:hypothetical protein [Mycobacterium colombiense]
MNASVAVAIAAIAAASIFNVVTLRRSSTTLKLAEKTYIRTEQRYQADWQKARNDQFRDALIDVAVAVTKFNVANAWYAKLLYDYAAGHIGPGPAQKHDLEQLRPAVSEAYRAIQVALFVSDIDEITAIVKDIERQILRATDLVSSHRLTVTGVREAKAAFERYRATAAKKATELLEIARPLLCAPEPPGQGDGS